MLLYIQKIACNKLCFQAKGNKKIFLEVNVSQTYEYIKLIGLLGLMAGFIKLIIGFFGYSYGVHYLSSFIILGIVVYLLGLIIQKQTEVKEE